MNIELEENANQNQDKIYYFPFLTYISVSMTLMCLHLLGISSTGSFKFIKLHPIASSCIKWCQETKTSQKEPKGAVWRHIKSLGAMGSHM
jgi:hypothetical protein